MIIVKDHDGNWAGVYKNGELIWQDHISNVEHWLLYDHFGLEQEEVPFDEDRMEFPIYLDEICPHL